MSVFFLSSFGALLAPKLLFAGYLLLIFSAFLCGLYNYRRLKIYYKLLTQLLGFIFMSEILGHFLSKNLGTNYPFYHFLTIIQLLYYGGIFNSLFINFKRKTKLALPLAVILSVVSLYISFFYQGIFNFPSISNVLLALYVVVMSLNLFFNMMQAPEPTPILLQPSFWFGSGSLFFYAITFFIFGYYDLLLDMKTDFPNWYMPLVHFANYILYSCYLITIILAANPKRFAK